MKQLFHFRNDLKYKYMNFPGIIDVILTDISGRVIRLAWKNPRENPAIIELKMPDLPGVYLIRILTGRKEQHA